MPGTFSFKILERHMTKNRYLVNALGGSIAAAVGGLAGWWLESRSREPEQEERTRVRLRRWQLR